MSYKVFMTVFLCFESLKKYLNFFFFFYISIFAKNIFQQLNMG